MMYILHLSQTLATISFIFPTFVELAEERVAGGAKPSKTDTVAPTSERDKELICVQKTIMK